MFFKNFQFSNLNVEEVFSLKHIMLLSFDNKKLRCINTSAHNLKLVNLLQSDHSFQSFLCNFHKDAHAEKKIRKLCMNIDNHYYEFIGFINKKWWHFFKKHNEIIILVHNITEYVKEYHYYNKNYETQLKINKTKSSFLSRLSHEFRTPLNAVIGYSDAIKHKLHGDISTPYLEYIHHIHDAGIYLLDIVNDIMDISYAENNHVSLKPSQFVILENIENIINFMQSLTVKHKIKINLHYNIERNFEIYNDLNLFKRIFINIIGNATKYCPPYTNIDISIYCEQENIKILVRDYGEGYPNLVIKNFGLPFNVDHNFLTNNQKSTGLGLAIIYTAIQAMHGKVNISNHQEGGALMHIELPLRYENNHIKAKII